MLNSCALGVSVVNIDNGFGRGDYGVADQPSVGTRRGRYARSIESESPASVKVPPMQPSALRASNSIGSSRRQGLSR
jgi:hypothetical protein